MSKLTTEVALKRYETFVTPIFSHWGLINPSQTKNRNFPYFTSHDLKKMMTDKRYFDDSYNDMMRHIVLAENLYNNGCIDKQPWWNTKNKAPDIAKGLAALYPIVQETSKGPVLTYTQKHFDSPLITVTADRIIVNDELSIHSTTSSLNKISNQDKETNILAAQQLGILKWGVIALSGSPRYIDKSIKIASKNATWQFISNPELYKEISTAVKNEAGVNEIWKRFSDTPLDENFTAMQVENMLFKQFNNAMFIIERDIETFSSNEQEEIKAYLEHMGNFDRLLPGDFLNRIIQSQQDPTKEFSLAFHTLFNFLDKRPELLEKINMIADEEARMNGIVIDGKRQPNEILDGKQEYNSPIYNISSLAIDSKVVTPNDYAQKLETVIENIRAIMNVPNLSDNERALLTNTLQKAQQIYDIKNNDIMVFQEIINHETYPETAFSKNLQDVRALANKYDIDTIIPEFTTNMREEFANRDHPEYSKGYERYVLREGVKNPYEARMFMQNHDGTHCTIGTFTYAWKYIEDAHGPSLKLLPENGGMPIAVMKEDLIISESRNNDLHQTQLEAIIEKTLGSTSRILSTEQMEAKKSEAPSTFAPEEQQVLVPTNQEKQEQHQTVEQKPEFS